MDKVFDKCVNFLDNIAERTGLSYKQVNVIIFCIAWPGITLWLAYKAFKK